MSKCPNKIQGYQNISFIISKLIMSNNYYSLLQVIQILLFCVATLFLFNLKMVKSRYFFLSQQSFPIIKLHALQMLHYFRANIKIMLYFELLIIEL